METVKNMFSPSEKVVTVNRSPEVKAQQQFKDDADLNQIIKKFGLVAARNHFAEHGLQYGFASPQDLHTAMNTIRTAETMFNELPSKVRNRFDNEPEAFLAFVQDGNNYEEAKSLGIGLAPGVEPVVKAEDPPPPPPPPPAE